MGPARTESPISYLLRLRFTSTTRSFYRQRSFHFASNRSKNWNHHLNKQANLFFSTLWAHKTRPFSRSLLANTNSVSSLNFKFAFSLLVVSCASLLSVLAQPSIEQWGIFELSL